MDIDVLVVGAGPTGLTLAAELLTHGLRPLVVDRAPAPSPLSRAIVVHARTLEVLEAHGLSDRLVEAGNPLRGVRIWGDGRVVVDVSFGALRSRYPFILAISQSETEAILHDRVVALGGEVVRGVGLVGFDADPRGATARLSDGREVRAAWLVGCDGSHSVVRHGLGLEFPGHAYEERLILGDVVWDVDLPHDRLSTFLGDGFLACFPLGNGRWRLIGTCERADDGSDAVLDDLAPLAARLTGLPGVLSDPAWLARFRIHARQVDRYRAGRVLLAGDSAHIHSPVGGQGMNTGIQDAHNLGWKLASVHRGAPDTLLDSYPAERHPVATQILRATHAATRIGTSRNPVVRAVRNHAASALSQLCLVTDRVTHAVAELDVSYAGSPIVRDIGARDDGPAAGDRPAGLPVDVRHVLLLLAGPQTTDDGRRRLRMCVAYARDAYGDRVTVRESPDLLGSRSDGLAVVRPDGYLGLRLDPADPEGFARWLEQTLGAPRSWAH